VQSWQKPATTSLVLVPQLRSVGVDARAVCDAPHADFDGAADPVVVVGVPVTQVLRALAPPLLRGGPAR
jgi:hypothetical protein